MRNPGLVLLFVPLVLAPGCFANIRETAAFKRTEVLPERTLAAVGDVVPFELRPAARLGTMWLLESHGHARFAGPEPTGTLQWVSEGKPIHMEALVAPWKPADSYEEEAARGWLWYQGVETGADSQSLDRELPIEREPFHQIGQVSVSTVFSLAPVFKDRRLTAGEANDRVVVHYKTANDQGVPLAPGVGAMLLETGGKRRLYVEVWTNFGSTRKEPMGYDVTLSYPKSVAGPVEVIVAEWVGHGSYFGPFEVTRMVVGGAPSKAAEPAAPAPSGSDAPAPPPAEAAPAPSTAPAPAPAGAAP